jgi:recombinational DNA repair protein (RecF pathway)
MPDFTQCVRCGRTTSTGATSFASWRISEDGRAICPHCLTPNEKVADDTPLLTDNPDDELLRSLDPDNDR